MGQIIEVENQKLYLFGGKGCPLSNFAYSRFDFNYQSNVYSSLTVEHAFQASKTTNLQQIKEVMAANGPSEAKRLGRKVTLRPEWETDIEFYDQVIPYKVHVMLEICKNKYSIPQFKEALQNTEKMILVEKAPWDPVWGAGKQGKGSNYLGRVLMSVRDHDGLYIPEQTPFIPV